MATQQGYVTFTPAAPGNVILLVDFEAQGFSGGDWGTAYTVTPFVTQNGTTTYGQAQRLTTTRLKYSVQGAFSVVVGAAVNAGVELACSGATSAALWSANVRAHLVKN